MYLETDSIVMMMDSIYPNVVENAMATFGYLVQYPDTMPADVVDHIANKRQNYAPWYTAIQDNINAAKQETVATITGSIHQFEEDVTNKMEAAHEKMVATITATGCNSYMMYEQDYIMKLSQLLGTMSMGFYSYTSNVQGSIPTNMVMTLSSTIQNVMYTYGSPVSTLTLVKQVRKII